jgi:hypothetical protein
MKIVSVIIFLLVSLTASSAQDDLNNQNFTNNATDPIIIDNETSVILANSPTNNTDLLPEKNGMLSIVEELLNWYIPILNLDDANAVAPMQYASTCNMLCSVGWEEDLTSSDFTRNKVLRCKTVNLTKIEFEPDECNDESGTCSRVLEQF